MNIGLVVDGDAEYGAFRLAEFRQELSRLHGGPVAVKVLKADIQPTSAEAIQAKAARAALMRLDTWADLLVVVVDREGGGGKLRGESRLSVCCGALADALQDVLEPTNAPARVVIKDRQFENWLVAVLASYGKEVAGFQKLSNGDMGHVRAADTSPAAEILKRTHRQGYGKTQHGREIWRVAALDSAAEYSRSLRKFLGCLGVPLYQGQTKKYVAPDS